MGKAILEILQRLYGSGFLQKIIGTRANVVKPKEFDINAPTKNIYSKDAFNDEKLIEKIDEQIMEYAPYILSNRNTREQANFLENAKKLLETRKKQTGSTFPDPTKEVKKEADIVDIKTGAKVDEEGIMSLKDELGLPPEVSPTSPIGKNLLELKKATKKADIAKKDMDETVDKGLESIFQSFMKQPGRDLIMEGKRRAVIRKILLMDDRVDIPADLRKRIEDMDDLKGDTEVDPLTVFDRFYLRNNKQLEVLDDVIDTAGNAKEAAEEFLKKSEKFELKPAMEKDVADKLKDLPDDIDPDAMATGGRVGFSVGSLTAKGILELMQSKFGKDAMKMADEVDRPESALNREMFKEFDERVSRKTLDVPETPKGFKLNKDKLLKNFPEIDEEFADEIMAMDKNMQIRVIEMIKDRRKNPESYDKLLMEKGDSLDFQGEFDRSVQRSKNADGGLGYLMGM